MIFTETEPLKFPDFVFMFPSCAACSSVIQINAGGNPWVRLVEIYHIYTVYTVYVSIKWDYVDPL